tara:strand:+ start:1018 stop:1731 length:714 start_codon:yes stop_codon:yes gene_type:complete
MSLKSRTVSRGLAELAKLNIITRHATLRATPEGKQYHHRAINQINISVIIQMVDVDTKALPHVTADSTPKALPHVTADSTPKALPHVTVDSTPSVSDDIVLSLPPVTLDSTPYVTLDSTPSVTADSTPYVTLDSTPSVKLADITTKEITTKETIKENNNNTAEIDLSKIKSADELGLSERERAVVISSRLEGLSETFLIKAILDARKSNGGSKLQYRRDQEKRSTRSESTCNPYKLY